MSLQNRSRKDLVVLLFVAGMGVGLFSILNQFISGIVLPIIDATLDTNIRNYIVEIGEGGPSRALFIGPLISTVISLLIFVYILLAVVRWHPWDSSQDADKKECPYCLSLIPVAATRCAYCAADVMGAAPTD